MALKSKISLSKNLNALIKERGISISSVAERVGMNRSTLHNYCNGTVPRHLITLQKLADFFNVSLGSLISDISDSQKAPPAPAIQGKYELIIKPMGAIEVSKIGNTNED